MQHHSVSLAIPVYNGDQYLRGALQSAQSQTTPADEILVFDNASTDTSAAVVRDILGDDALRGAAANGGASWNFTRAVQESSGHYFAWLAADDEFAPEFVEMTVAALERAPESPACLTGIAFIDTAGNIVGSQRDPALASPSESRRFNSFINRGRWTESYCMYRREALLASPMFSPDYGADVLLTWWFLLRGPITVIEAPLLRYRTYPTKSIEAANQSLLPGSPRRDWRMMRMWGALWRLTRASDVPRKVRLVAQAHLLMALARRYWIIHNASDVIRFAQYRVPFLRRWKNLL